MRRYRGALTFAAFAALSAASMATALFVLMNRLPDPELADSKDLFRWLVTRDVQAESPETQQKLLYRAEAELRSGADARQVTDSLDDRQKALLQKNVEFLARLWFERKVDAYFASPPAERAAQLDRQIDDVGSWGAVQQVLASDQRPQAAANDWAMTAGMVKRVDSWIEAAEPEDRERMTQYVAAMQRRLVLRKFQAFMGNSAG